MKRLLIVILTLVAVLAFALVGCDSEQGGETETEAHVCALGEWITIKDATCTEDGKKERACECGEKETQSIAALGHTEVIDAAVAKTCIDSGLTEGKHCSVCEEVLVAQETVPASHEWKKEYGWDKGVHWQICSVCEQTGSQVAHTLSSDGYCAECDNPIAGSDGVLYFPSADGTYAEVADYVGTSERVVISEKYEGMPVSKIADSAFEGKSITSVYIPSSITSIGKSAFESCSSLTSVTFGEKSRLESIGIRAFFGCGRLANIDVPNSVTSISGEAFFWCSSLANVTFAENSQLTYIGYWAFSGCGRLTSITIPESVTVIGNDAFRDCYNLVEKVDGVSYVDDSVVDFDNTVASVTLREGTRKIYNSAFYEGSKLRNIAIPSSVTSIGEYAFEYCNSLTSINFGGTKAQWNAISKGSNWNYETGYYTVYCTDGTISK